VRRRLEAEHGWHCARVVPRGYFLEERRMWATRNLSSFRREANRGLWEASATTDDADYWREERVRISGRAGSPRSRGDGVASGNRGSLMENHVSP